MPEEKLHSSSPRPVLAGRPPTGWPGPMEQDGPVRQMQVPTTNAPENDNDASSDESDGFGGLLYQLSARESQGAALSRSLNGTSRQGVETSPIDGRLRTQLMQNEPMEDPEVQMGTLRGHVRSTLADLLSSRNPSTGAITAALDPKLDELGDSIPGTECTAVALPATRRPQMPSSPNRIGQRPPSKPVSPKKLTPVKRVHSVLGQLEQGAKLICLDPINRPSCPSPSLDPLTNPLSTLSKAEDAQFMSMFAPPSIRAPVKKATTSAPPVSESPMTADSQMSTGLHRDSRGFGPDSAHAPPSPMFGGVKMEDWNGVHAPLTLDRLLVSSPAPARSTSPQGGDGVQQDSAREQLIKVLQGLSAEERKVAHRVLAAALRLQERHRARSNAAQRMRELLSGNKLLAGLPPKEIDYLIQLVMDGDRLRPGVRSLIKQHRRAKSLATGDVSDGEFDRGDLSDDDDADSQRQDRSPRTPLLHNPSLISAPSSNAEMHMAAGLWRSPRRSRPSVRSLEMDDDSGEDE